MKNNLASTLLLLLLSAPLVSLAQQKVNDALLLDMYQNQHYAEAAAYLKNAYPEPVTDVKILSRLAYTYQMAGKLPDAEAYYLRIYQTDSTNVPLLFNLANIYVKREFTAKAVTIYKKIIAIDSLNFTVYKQLGKLSENPAETLTYLQKANKLNPQDGDVASELSYGLIDLKQFKQAQKVLTVAMAADTDNLQLLRAMLKLTYSLKKYPETIKAGEHIVGLGDKSGFVVNKLGESYYMIKNYQCCIETFALLPDIMQNETSCYFTAESYKALKNQPMAIAFFEKALVQAISPVTHLYYSEMADSYQELNKLKNCIANYQKSLFFKEDGLIYYSLANLYDTKLNDKKNALKYYKKYIDSKPPEKQKDYITYVESRILELKK